MSDTERKINERERVKKKTDKDKSKERNEIEEGRDEGKKGSGSFVF